MKVMLDTNVCIDLLRKGDARAMERIKAIGENGAGISSITLAELMYGASKSARREHHAGLVALLCAPLEIAEFGEEAAEAYGEIRSDLERSGKGIGPLDTLIAAAAMAEGAVLWTSNVREFRRVKGLRVERW